MAVDIGTRSDRPHDARGNGGHVVSAVCLMMLLHASARIAVLSLIFWLFWTQVGVGAKYFWYLPSQYSRPAWLDLAGVFSCIEILKAILLPNLKK